MPPSPWSQPRVATPLGELERKQGTRRVTQMRGSTVSEALKDCLVFDMPVTIELSG